MFFLCRPTCLCWHLSNLAVSTKWQMILCQNSIQNTVWYDAQPVMSTTKDMKSISSFLLQNYLFLHKYMVCWIVLFVFSIVTCCPWLWTDPVEKHFVCVCVVLYRQGAPVCSVMGKTYSNECLLHKEACRKKRRIGKAHSGSCIGTHTQTQKL